MLNNKQVERAVSEAEQSFKDCWSKLITIRNVGDDKSGLLNAVTSFQPTLGNALFKLETFYNIVCKESRELIRRKSILNPKWFRRRIHAFNGYKRLIQSTVDVGKVLGDSFAWLFYQYDRELLRKHYEQQFSPHPPTGIGGRGEIEFVSRLPKFGRYVVVAHSTTTFLRLGDVSLIDPVSYKVAAIGELKTRADGQAHLITTVNLVGPKLSQEMLPSLTLSNPTKATLPNVPLPPQMLDRLKKQIGRMRESFKPVDKERILTPADIGVTYNCSKLTDLYRGSSRRTWGHTKADRGLLIVGLKLREGTLYDRLTQRSAAINKRNLGRIGEAAREIIDSSIQDNSILFHWLPYPAHGRYSLLLGMRPLFWWPLNFEVIEALLFKRFASMTVYNPAFLIRDIRQAGIEVKTNKDGTIEIWKKAGQRRLEVKGITFFLSLVQEYLFPDSSVAELIKKTVEVAENTDFKHSARINLDLRFSFS